MQNSMLSAPILINFAFLFPCLKIHFPTCSPGSDDINRQNLSVEMLPLLESGIATSEIYRDLSQIMNVEAEKLGEVSFKKN